MIVLSALVACRDLGPRPGTFVGNPELSARMAESQEVRVVDGYLNALEVLLGDCDGVGDVPLGARLLEFDGSIPSEVGQIPVGTHCGVFFAVNGFELRIDEGAPELTTLVADGFDLFVRTRFSALEEQEYTVVFGSQEWLEGLAELAGPGETSIESSPELQDAFFGGLDSSNVTSGNTATTATVPTRVDPEYWPVSPNGVPASGVACEEGSRARMAVPIPPAAMLSAGYSLDVGWCEAEITFEPDLQAGYQTDWATGDVYQMVYSGWSQGCGELHCGTLTDHRGDAYDLPCTALAVCDSGVATVTGFLW